MALLLRSDWARRQTSKNFSGNKNGSSKEKQESWKPLTQLGDLIKNLYIRCSHDTFVFLEKKKTFLKNHIGKSCVGRKDCHRWTLPENTIFEISYLHLATSTASRHQQNPPAHHHAEVSRVCASIFLSQRRSTWRVPCQVCTSLTNHRALFTTTKTQLFRIHYSACSRSGWTSFVSFFFLSLLVLTNTASFIWTRHLGTYCCTN